MRSILGVLKMKLIAGIDPGMITAVAAVDIESGFYQTYSKRGLAFTEICDYLVTLGESIIVSVDTMHAPDTVKRVAAAFNARLYYPKRDLYIGEKKRITDGTDIKNDHERDALAAALHAKSFFSPLFSKIDNTLEAKSLVHLSADIKELLVKRETGNIEQAIKLLMGEDRQEIKIVPRLIGTKKILELRRTIENLEKEKLAMEKKVEILEKENEKLRKPVHWDESIAMRNLRKSLASLVSEKRGIEKEYTLYKDLSARYEILGEGADIKNKIILFRDGMDIAKIEKLGPKAIISDKFLDTSIPLINPGRIKIQKIGNLFAVEKDEIANALGKESFIEWLSQYKEMRRNEA